MGRDIQAIKISGEDRRIYRDKVWRSLEAFAAMLRGRMFETRGVAGRPGDRAEPGGLGRDAVHA